jgi:hypothetical protein
VVFDFSISAFRPALPSDLWISVFQFSVSQLLDSDRFLKPVRACLDVEIAFRVSAARSLTPAGWHICRNGTFTIQLFFRGLVLRAPRAKNQATEK